MALCSSCECELPWLWLQELAAMDPSRWRLALRSFSPGRKAPSVGGRRLGVRLPYDQLQSEMPAWCAWCDIAMRDFGGPVPCGSPD